MRISIAIITKNEEGNLARCLRAVAWADERIVLDHHSTDRTIEIAHEHGALVHTADWDGFGKAKQRSIELASGDWIFSLDADEEVTPELADEIRERIENAGDMNGFYVRRRNLFLGRWINHCGWYPDYTLRIFRKGKGQFDDAPVHEVLTVSGKTMRLAGELRHYNYPTLESYLAKSNLYTTLGARKAYDAGVRTSLFDLTIRPCVSFLSHYIVKQGFRDGLEGLMISKLSAKAVFVKYAKLKELENNARTQKNR